MPHHIPSPGASIAKRYSLDVRFSNIGDTKRYMTFPARSPSMAARSCILRKGVFILNGFFLGLGYAMSIDNIWRQH